MQLAQFSEYQNLLNSIRILQFENLHPWAIGGQRRRRVEQKGYPMDNDVSVRAKVATTKRVSSPNCRATKPEGKNIGAFPTSMFP